MRNFDFCGASAGFYGPFSETGKGVVRYLHFNTGLAYINTNLVELGTGVMEDPTELILIRELL